MSGAIMYFPTQPLVWSIACLFGALAIATLVRVSCFHRFSDETVHSQRKSLRTWWVLTLVLAIALLLGDIGVALLLAVAGILGLREYLQIVGWKQVGLPTALFVFTTVPAYYLLLLFGYQELLQTTAPIVFLFAIGSLRACLGLVEEYTRLTAALIWGLMLFVFCLSHAYFILKMPGHPYVGNMGWFLYLILLTESNDIAQAIVGRRFGRTKIARRTSPKKSLEGLLGGIAVTMVLAVLLSPWLTGLMEKSTWNSGVIASLLSGLLISIFGFLGDINKSGIKRDVGIKDSGTILPGQGGVMDRIDSLTFSAPAFHFFVHTIFPVI